MSHSAIFPQLTRLCIGSTGNGKKETAEYQKGVVDSIRYKSVSLGKALTLDEMQYETISKDSPQSYRSSSIVLTVGAPSLVLLS